MLEENNNNNVLITLLTLSYDETLHHVGMGRSASHGTDYVYGFIDNNWGIKSTEQYIYDYTYNLVYPDLANEYKELFANSISLLFSGVNLYVLPDFITWEMLGFSNV